MTETRSKPNVLLLDPPDFVGALTRNLQLPLGLIALYNYLAKAKAANTIHLADLTLSYLQQEHFGHSPLRLLKSSLPSLFWDIVGITTHFTNTLASLSLAKYLKWHNPNALIVLGGVHATSCAASLLKNFDYIDLVVSGEGEQSLLALCKEWGSLSTKKKQFNAVPNAVFLDNQGALRETPKQFLDLSQIKPYDFSCVDIGSYVKASRVNSFWMESGRGCVFKCGFCISAKHWGYRSRYFASDKIVSDMATLNKLGIHKIKFTHDQFTVNKKKVVSICEKIIQADLSMEWGCYSRADEFPFLELPLMAKAGCTEIFIGVESTMAQIQKDIRKPIPSEKIDSIMAACSTENIQLESNVVLGFPEHNEKSLLDELLFCCILKTRQFSRLSISPLELYPSTPFYKNAAFRELFLLKKNLNALEELFSFKFEHRKSFWGLSLKAVAEFFRVITTYFPSTFKALLSSAEGYEWLSKWLRAHAIDLIEIHKRENLDHFPILLRLLFNEWANDSVVGDFLLAEAAVALVSIQLGSSIEITTPRGSLLLYDGRAATAHIRLLHEENGMFVAHPQGKFSFLTVHNDNEDIELNIQYDKGGVSENHKETSENYPPEFLGSALRTPAALSGRVFIA